MGSTSLMTIGELTEKEVAYLILKVDIIDPTERKLIWRFPFELLIGFRVWLIGVSYLGAVNYRFQSLVDWCVLLGCC